MYTPVRHEADRCANTVIRTNSSKSNFQLRARENTHQTNLRGCHTEAKVCVVFNFTQTHRHARKTDETEYATSMLVRETTHTKACPFSRWNDGVASCRQCPRQGRVLRRQVLVVGGGARLRECRHYETTSSRIGQNCFPHASLRVPLSVCVIIPFKKAPPKRQFTLGLLQQRRRRRETRLHRLPASNTTVVRRQYCCSRTEEAH